MRNRKEGKKEDTEHKKRMFIRPDVKPANYSFGGGLNVVVSIPKTLEVRMVDASILADYELWMILTTILSSAFGGFLIAAVQSNHEVRLWIDVGVFGMLFTISLVTALYKRTRVWRRSRSILLRTAPRPHRSSPKKNFKELTSYSKSLKATFRRGKVDPLNWEFATPEELYKKEIEGLKG